MTRFFVVGVVILFFFCLFESSRADWDCDTSSSDEEGWWCSHCGGGIENCYINPHDNQYPAAITDNCPHHVCMCVDDQPSGSHNEILHINPQDCSQSKRLNITLNVWGDADTNDEYILRICDGTQCSGNETVLLEINSGQGCHSGSGKRNGCPEGISVLTSGCHACLCYEYDDDQHGFAIQYECVDLPEDPPSSATTAIIPQIILSSETSSTVPVCGNGIIEGNEECDDGNTDNDDGCSDACEKEYPKILPSGCSLNCNGMQPTRTAQSGTICDFDPSQSQRHCIWTIAPDGCYGGQINITILTYLDSVLSSTQTNDNTIDCCYQLDILDWNDTVVASHGTIGNSDDKDFRKCFHDCSCFDCLCSECSDECAMPCGSYDGTDNCTLPRPSTCPMGTTYVIEGCNATIEWQSDEDSTGFAIFYTSRLLPPVAICGNGLVENGEECDDGVANSDTEPDACREDCTFPVCTDGVNDTDTEFSCPDGWVKYAWYNCDGSNGVYCYKFPNKTCPSRGYPGCYNIINPWDEAEQQCVEEGAHLVSIHCLEEATFVHANTPLGEPLVHIGGYREIGDCEYHWIDGTEFVNANNIVNGWGWDGGQPQCGTNSEILMFFGIVGTHFWHDGEPWNRYFVCKKPATWNCADVCGNGLVENEEQCDDGNIVDGDGCSANCALEGDICGNGVLDGCEECDDGNLIDGDCCSSQCIIEDCCRFDSPKHCYGRDGVNLCPETRCCEFHEDCMDCVKVSLSQVKEYAPCCTLDEEIYIGDCSCSLNRMCEQAQPSHTTPILRRPYRHTSGSQILAEYDFLNSNSRIAIRYWPIIPGPQIYHSGDETVIAPPGSIKMDITMTDWFFFGENCTELWIVLILHIPGMGEITTNTTTGIISAPLPCGSLFTASFAHTAGAGTENPAVKLTMQVQDRFVRVFLKIEHFSGPDLHYDPVFALSSM